MRPATNTFPLEHSYAQLVDMEKIQDELKDRFGKKEAKRIVDDIRKGELETLYARGGYGSYRVSIMNYGPVYWIDAPEYDPIKYFKTKKEAISFAESTYETKA